MKNTVIYPLFKKVFALCERNSILTAEIRQNAVINLKYGPLGVLLKRNLYEEWLSHVINNSDVPMFSVEEHETLKYDQPINSVETSDQETLLSEIQNQYNATLPLVGEKLPFGFALMGHSSQHCSTEHLTKSNNSPDLLWRLRKWTTLSVVFFGTLSKSTDWFHYWQQQRYSWWRKFCAVPSQIFMSDIVQAPPGGQQVSMRMKSTTSNNFWNLETVTVSEKANFDLLLDNVFRSKNKMESAKPSLIMCQMDLDFAVVSYLYDAYEEKNSRGKQKTVLRLHQKLAPYKVTVAIDCPDSESVEKLDDVNRRLIKEFKKSGIAILPNPYLNSELSVSSQFDRFDEMGIPYTVVLSQKTLDTGVIGLRNRDTTISEEVHVTELNSKLLMYLQLNNGNKS